MNKYSELFREDMTNNEAMYVFCSTFDSIPSEDRELFTQAFNEAQDKILDREFKKEFERLGLNT